MAVAAEGQQSHFACPIDARRAGIETIRTWRWQVTWVSEHFLGREAKRKYLGLLQTLDESFTSQESWRVLDTLDIHFANFEE